MPIDKVDIAREEARRADKKRDANRKDASRQQAGKDFASRYQAKSKAREVRETEAKNRQGAAGKEGDSTISRIVQALKGAGEGKEQDKQETKKKDEAKKEKFQEGSESRSKSVSEEGHSRVAEKQSSQEGGSGSEGRSGGGGGGAGEQSGGSGKQAGSGFSDSGGQKEKGLSQREQAALYQKAAKAQTRVGRGSFSASIGGRQAGSRGFTRKALDEVVESVRVMTNEHMEKEMEITLSDEYFSGLRLKATQTADGVVITFHCPNVDIRNTFLFSRPQLYSRLREKKIAVSRIDVV